MILVDPRAGSKELVEPLRTAGLPVDDEARLDFGDLAFMGRGEGGKQIFIGIEHKKLPDLISSLNSDRLIFQIRGNYEHPGGMLEMYDRPYLIIEGVWDVDDNGYVVVPAPYAPTQWIRLKGAPFAAELEKRIQVLELRAGLRVRWTRSQKETIRHVSTLYRVWTDRDLDEHRSHLALHAPDLDSALRVPLSLRRQVAAQLPGVGYEKSRAVEQHFPSIWAMANASVEEWKKVAGIGKTLASRLYAAIREE